MNNNIQQQTTINIQEKANLIWAIADKLVGIYKPHEYGNDLFPCALSNALKIPLHLPSRLFLTQMPNLIKDGIVVKKGSWKQLPGSNSITFLRHISKPAERPREYQREL